MSRQYGGLAIMPASGSYAGSQQMVPYGMASGSYGGPSSLINSDRTAFDYNNDGYQISQAVKSDLAMPWMDAAKYTGD